MSGSITQRFTSSICSRKRSSMVIQAYRWQVDSIASKRRRLYEFDNGVLNNMDETCELPKCKHMRVKRQERPTRTVSPSSTGPAIAQCVAKLEWLVDSYGSKLKDDGLWPELKNLRAILQQPSTLRGSAVDDDLRAHDVKVKRFVSFGGFELLVELLLRNETDIPHSNLLTREMRLCMRNKTLLLQIIDELIVTSKTVGPQIATRVIESDELVEYAFAMLAYEQPYYTASQLLEDALQFSDTAFSFSLQRITALPELVQQFDSKRLANFCRLLAIVISDADSFKTPLHEQNRDKRLRGNAVNLRDANQDVLLGVPNFLKRLVSVAFDDINYEPPAYRARNSEIDAWTERIDREANESVFEELATDDDLVTFVGGLSVPNAHADEPQRNGTTSLRNASFYNLQKSLQISFALIDHVEVIYVIGLFLVGRHRKRVQKSLAELGFVSQLQRLFDSFTWRCNSRNDRHRLRGHNPSCECNPEVALKIQVLRVIHSFCDHSDYKHLLLTPSEFDRLVVLNQSADRTARASELTRLDTTLMCTGERGLLAALVEIMQLEPAGSTFRFWLARAVESFLRGATAYCDQAFLIERGLLTHLGRFLLANDRAGREILQSTFDLLSELCKFNVDAFRELDTLLNDTSDRFDRLIHLMNENLVDSNMFVRALVLTFDCFTAVEAQHRAYATRESVLLRYIARQSTQIDYVRRLVALLRVDAITQENISCLNTSIIILLFAGQSGRLAEYLRTLRNYKPPSRSAMPPAPTSAGRNAVEHDEDDVRMDGRTILCNLRSLLIFWQDHYLSKDKDCSGLEKGTRIPFETWRVAIDGLLSRNTDSELSIGHYLD